ncbi:MAG: AAA family ATPase [Desulfuromonadaceae bacterium]|nr:AAA family ATPase [Desulfuromonadaceae bacterium]
MQDLHTATVTDPASQHNETTVRHTTLNALMAQIQPQSCTYSVKEVLGIPSNMQLPGFSPGHPLVPQQSRDYIWDESLARDFIEWLSEAQPEPLWISGPTGCGKTEALKNLFAALHVPTVLVSAKKSTEPDDILGRVQLVNGNTVFVPGPLLDAYARGYAIIFDEIDGYNPEVMMA